MRKNMKLQFCLSLSEHSYSLNMWYNQYFWAEVLLEGIRWLAFVSGAKVSLRFQHHKEVSQFLQIVFFTNNNNKTILCFESHSTEIPSLLVSAMKTAVERLYLWGFHEDRVADSNWWESSCWCTLAQVGSRQPTGLATHRTRCRAYVFICSK